MISEPVDFLRAGRFWPAREEWEELWQANREPFYKGMIQLAAGLFHLRRRNYRGARRLLRTCQGYAQREEPVELTLNALVTSW